MQLIDTHCHIQSIGQNSGEEGTMRLWHKADGLTPEIVIANASDHGVEKMICVGCDLADSELAIDFVKDKDNLYASIGIHPHEAKHYINDQAKVDQFKLLVDSDKVVAVGECGLDYFYNHSNRDDQIKILEIQIELALKHNLPLIFHVREAFDDFWPIFEAYPGIRGVLHSFTDNLANLERALTYGLYIGVNGIATFAKEDQTKVYKAIPLKSLLLETDSPFLTPEPFRGTINEPMRVGVVAEYLAKVRGESLEDLSKNTSLNAINLFGL
jgi:TatD DNase family protein